MAEPWRGNIFRPQVSRNTTLRTTKDGLYRFQNATNKGSRPWKAHAMKVAGAIEAREQDRQKLDETVNRLERLLFDTKQTLAEETRLEDMASKGEREALATAVQVTDRWFLNQQQFEQESVERKLRLLEDAVGSVMCRVQNAELLPAVEMNMTKVIDAVEMTVKKCWAANKKKRPKRREVRALLRKVADLQLWYGERKRRQNRLTAVDNPSLLWSELRDRIHAINTKRAEMDDELTGRASQVTGRKREDVYVYPPESVNVKIN
jgi:hypothetical protein